MRALNRNLTVALLLSVVVAGMVGLSFAAVPLYSLFCQVTGFGGTPQVAEQAPDALEERRITVRFNADIVPQLPWSFQPAKRSITLPIGEETLAFYRAENLTDRPLVGTATFNVTPLKAGQYFVKIDCFCFTEQRLEPGQKVEMPVSFFVDPAIVEDPNLAEVHTITLSYTFFPAEEETPRAAADGQASAEPGAVAGTIN